MKNKRSITDTLAGFIKVIYTSQIVYIMYCTIQSMNRDLVRPLPATRGGRTDRDHISDMITADFI